MKKAPTAEQVISKLIGLEVILRKAGVFDEVVDRMNVHARNHTKIALETAANDAETKSPRISGVGIGGNKEYPIVSGDVILNAYPLINIK